ncbi:MAG: MarR family winged helix-turn-helix transcriptional regulator [Opitutales bacterium]
MAETNPVRPLPCLCAELKRASRAVTRLYDDAQRPLGLSSGQMTLLFALANGPRSQTQLGETFSMDTTTLTRTLRTLGREGYVATREGTADRRERWHELTQKGRQAVKRGNVLWRQVQGDFLRRLEGKVRFEEAQAVLHAIVAASEE